MSTEITLSTGETVRVYPAGNFAILAAQAAIALPALPMVEEHVGPAEGGHSEAHVAAADSPAYRTYMADMAEAQRRRDVAVDEAWYLLGLRDVEPPAAWVFPHALELLGIAPREGEKGRRLDYIQYVLLENGEDLALVSRTIRTLSYSKAQLAQQLEDSFRRNGDHQRAAAGGSGATAGAEAAEAPAAAGAGAE